MNKRVALVGYGYWGPNLLRNFIDASGCEVVYVCDRDKTKLCKIKKRYPHVITTSSVAKIVKDKNIHGVIIATPTRTHFPLACRMIESGKDVLLEKPMTLTSQEAKKLVELAKRHKRVVMVDHTFLFNDAVMTVKKLIESGEIGDILYIDSVRVNLGLFQKDSNVIFDLATHDFSIIQYLLGSHPLSLNAHTSRYFGATDEVAYVFAKYPKGISVHVHVSWLSPAKIRRMLIVGTKKMIVYDDIEPTEKVRVYDKGVVVEKSLKELEEILIGYRTGDVWLPKVNVTEPLSLLAREFLECQRTRKLGRSDGKFGATVVEILESATKSAKLGKTVLFKHAGK